VVTGNAAANRLVGGGGADLLDGGAGADRMEGGADDDTYVVDDVGDVVVEAAGEGQDTVRAGVTFSLAGTAVEVLELTGTAAIDGTGNELANLLLGNAAANRLDGGAGADRMEGGAGDDLYMVDDVGDVVVELAGQGTDTVRASVTVSLAGTAVERLELTGTAAIDGTGTALANTLIGNAAANRLDGGAGADRMEGGAGDDTYIVDDAGDVVVEAAGGGVDTILSGVSRTLSSQVENLQLLGSADLDGTGNGLANTLTGNAGANRLDGAGGNDLIIGGGGADRLLGGDGSDRIVVADLSFVSVQGGTGSDTLTLGGLGADFDVSSLVGRVTGVETLDLRNGGTGEIDLRALDLVSLTDSGSLSLRLDRGDVLDFGADAGQFVVGASGVDADGAAWTTYTLAGSGETPPPPGGVTVYWHGG
jgi:Ca2+-binding RTX toxin-like protein